MSKAPVMTAGRAPGGGCLKIGQKCFLAIGRSECRPLIEPPYAAKGQERHQEVH